ncbi:site-specific DNA-methyltransferase [Rathayibacter sp. AY1H2]|uniref:site-specific DNA-methyltransferase n=1 Tax=Rathayibacter sp. AY1H2 TaxID=2080566 RepID=UPI000CE89243|nr:site-specific DNA-methyltransferase [Rathayibacter sp. AY1H2]PPG81466.1 site-specific DNA-methyltransferase [Rathayibacter sp. AY1H2]
MTDDIYETSSATPEFQTELVAQLADLIPEAIADGKVDIEKLKELLDGDVADGSERFGLFWPGKKRALRAAQEPTTATLKPDFENSKNWDTTQNVFIEGDNLEVLKILQKHYHAKIKLIYIDPPYNTGNDFVYPDKYKEGLDSYLEWTRQVNDEGKKVTTNAETEGRYHSNWLNMMYPRLKLARNLLKDDGVVVIHIDEHEHANLEKLLNEIFGEGCNLGSIVWDKRNPKGDATAVAQQHETIMLFCRNREAFKQAGDLTRPKANAQMMIEAAARATADAGGVNDISRKQYRGWLKQHATLTGGEAAYNQIDDDGNVYRPVSMAWPNKKKAPDDYFVALIHPLTGKPCPVPERGWRNPSSTMRALLEADQILFGRDETTQPTRKYLLKDNMYENVASVLYHAGSDDALLAEMGIPFDTPKPVDVAQRLIQSVTRGTDIVFDFFAGSGTAAHAVMSLNARDEGARRWIVVQLPEPTPPGSEARAKGFDSVAAIAHKRIDLAGDRVGADLVGQSVDAGFRVYKLAETNFSKWRLSSDVEEGALQQHLLSLRDSATDNATADELLTEILLKQGYSLTEAVSSAVINGLDIRLVRDRDGDVAVLAYLNEHVKPTLEQLRTLVDETPTRIIVLEDAFQGDDELKTNLVQLAKSKGVELWTA